MIARFAPIIGAGLSSDWEEVVAEHSAPDELGALLSGMADPGAAVGLDEVEALLESLEELLDLFDEEPMGSTYYPFKAAELIELHGRMATGDLPDDAPVPLAEWVDRFAKHVDWQLDKSGIDLGRPDYFAHLERTLRESGRDSDADGEREFAERIAECREKSAEYLSALNSALR
ncbi:hypothetical protein [Streptomyces sp. NBC_00691]|uniref:hypothetical protein n=1 Tax=Streptomyces sp. NBC_00691 TaxID=2903671 RepID=UPI002E37B9F4|nr:hypothetical protein [Streptomyces sp. NBC_00691]